MPAFPTAPYKGTRDFYPDASLSHTDDFRKRQYIFQTWRSTLRKLGFVEYDTSIIENAELYLAKSGEELGSKQLYSFEDKGGRLIALRPEMTPTLARIVSHKFGELKFPLRWFSIPNCFRYERPQKGRLREFWQLNVDIVGAEPGGADLELLLVISRLFKDFGAKKDQFKIMFNHRPSLDIWLDSFNLRDRQSIIYAVLDDWYKSPLQENQAKLADHLNPDEINLLTNLVQKQGNEFLKYQEITKSHPEMKLILESIQSIDPDTEYDFNPTIIRGLAYYTGIVIEGFDKNPENPRAMFGAGRYDNLLQLFGKEAKAVGVGVGEVTWHEFLEYWKLYPDFTNTQEKVGIMPFSDQDLTEVFTQITPKLEAEGKMYEIDYDFHRSEKKRWESLKKRGCQQILKLQQN